MSNNISSQTIPYRFVFFAYLLLYTGVLITVLAEYGLENGWNIMCVYCHFFLYPLLFGLVMFVLILKAVSLMMSVDAVKRRLKLIAMVLFAVIIGLVYAQFDQPAVIFEYKNDYLKTLKLEVLVNASAGKDNDKTKNLINCKEVTNSDSNGKNLRLVIDGSRERCIKTRSIFAHFAESSGDDTEVEKKFRKEFSEALGGSYGFSSASATKWLFYFTFAIQVAIICVAFFLFSFSMVLYKNKNKKFLVNKERVTELLFLIIVFAYPWLVMRRAYEIYKSRIYDIPTSVESATLSVVFASAIFCYLYISWSVSGKKIAEIVAAIFGLSCIGVMFYENSVEALFPRDASVSHYAIMALMMFVIVFGFSIRLESEEDR